MALEKDLISSGEWAYIPSKGFFSKKMYIILLFIFAIAIGIGVYYYVMPPTVISPY